MKTEEIVVVLNALSNESRLKIFRLLVENGKTGLNQTAVAEKTGNMPRTTLCFHLDLLREAGLCTAEKRGKSVIYRAKCQPVKKIAAFLLKDCCEGECQC